VRYGRWSLLFTMASMVMVVNSVVGAAAAAPAVALAARALSPAPAVIGVATGIVLLALARYHKHRRLTPVVLRSPAALAARGDNPGAT
jgi:hypothetical protein